jgi:hypothetical protein
MQHLITSYLNKSHCTPFNLKTATSPRSHKKQRKSKKDKENIVTKLLNYFGNATFDLYVFFAFVAQLLFAGSKIFVQW